jgi:uncharacterized protein involved in outer membrane biogenesis
LKLAKIILLAVGALGVLFIVGVLLLLQKVDTGAVKSRIETTASSILGMEVRVGGRLGFGFFPGLFVSLENVQLRNRDSELAVAEKIRIGLNPLPLLKKEVRISRVVVEKARITVERGLDGSFNFQPPEQQRQDLAAWTAPRISLREGDLVYLDRRSGTEFSAEGCRLEVRQLQLAPETSPDFMQNLALRADLACQEIRHDDFRGSNLALSADGRQGSYEFAPVTIRLFGAEGKGRILARFSGAEPEYAVDFSLPRFRIEEFIQTLTPQEVARGSMDFSAQLTMRGSEVEELRRTAAGRLALRGENLTFIGTDLDRMIGRFEATQTFNLVDVGAFLFVGPVGLAATKGVQFATIFQGSGGASEVRTLVSDWELEAGQARARDVALATGENRLALQGKLDLVNERFDNLTIALLDDRGCAVVKQQIHGPFQAPVVEQPSIIASLTGPVRRLLQRGARLFPGGECEVFYTGSVAPPAP